MGSTTTTPMDTPTTAMDTTTTTMGTATPPTTTATMGTTTPPTTTTTTTTKQHTAEHQLHPTADDADVQHDAGTDVQQQKDGHPGKCSWYMDEPGKLAGRLLERLQEDDPTDTPPRPPTTTDDHEPLNQQTLHQLAPATQEGDYKPQATLQVTPPAYTHGQR